MGGSDVDGELVGRELGALESEGASLPVGRLVGASVGDDEAVG